MIDLHDNKYKELANKVDNCNTFLRALYHVLRDTQIPVEEAVESIRSYRTFKKRKPRNPLTIRRS